MQDEEMTQVDEQLKGKKRSLTTDPAKAVAGSF
jgi:hypothetical protein